jgi:hypothetical protein
LPEMTDVNLSPNPCTPHLPYLILFDKLSPKMCLI